MNWSIVYAKFDGCKGFKAFDINEGRQVGNLIYASLVENTEDTRQKLQELAVEQGTSPCAATSQERQGVLPDKVKGNGQTNHLPTFFSFYGKVKRHQERADKGSD